ncbi:MAG: proline iminopeptidase-family hydrolase [Gammaproteobacteria bacterium]
MLQSQTQIVRLNNGFNVWTRRVGDQPVHMLLLHGGPGFTHEYFEGFGERLPAAGIAVHYYDQLGSYHSDQPDDPSLWTVERFREEVEEVRRALGLEQFYLLGQSWGGMLAIEYALAYQQHLKGLVISSMTASTAAYVRYVNELRNRLPREVLDVLKRYEDTGDYKAPAYEKLLWDELYSHHLCRTKPWPAPIMRGVAHMNKQVYNTMQGPNEFVVTGNFKDWDRWNDLQRIGVPTLLSVGRHDTMSAADIEEMARRIPDSRVAIHENAGHMAMWDNPDSYFGAVIGFVKEIEGTATKKA